MNDVTCQKVTIIYYSDTSLELLHAVETFPKAKNGRVIIPESFKVGKSIVAVCEGEVSILNRVGERITAIEKSA